VIGQEIIQGTAPSIEEEASVSFISSILSNSAPADLTEVEIDPSGLPAPEPVMKWVGGKGKLVSTLTSLAPREYGAYFEPFLGGGAFFFSLRPSISSIGDLNADLINLYSEIRRDPYAVRIAADLLCSSHEGDSYYYRIREIWNSSRELLSPVVRAATMIYLNRACFNGLWRENKRGRMNSPVGRRPDGSTRPMCPPLASLASVSVALRGAAISCADFEAVVAPAKPGDLVYFDPPFIAKTKTSSFKSYGAGGFTDDDQARLAACARELASRGVRVMASNADVPLARELYAGFRIHEVSCSYSISASGSSRGNRDEIVACAGWS